MASSGIRVGIIGGSGLEDIASILTDKSEFSYQPRWGLPSSKIYLGVLAGVPVALLSRHGPGHVFGAAEVPYRANLWALKQAGCTHVIAATACGSLHLDIAPGDFVVLDQFIDRTQGRVQSFYSSKVRAEGERSDDLEGVCHIPMGMPFCPSLSRVVAEGLQACGDISFKPKGTVVTIEGPRFSSRAESVWFKSTGAEVINMTTIPEAPLAREAGLCYAAIAMSTDYDSWHDSIVDVPTVLARMKKNSENFVRAVLEILPRVAGERTCGCTEAVKYSVLGN